MALKVASDFQTYFQRELQASTDELRANLIDLENLDHPAHKNQDHIIIQKRGFFAHNKPSGSALYYRNITVLDPQDGEWKTQKAAAQFYWDSPATRSNRVKTAWVGFLGLCLIAAIYTFSAPVSFPLTISLGTAGAFSGGVIFYQFILNVYRKNKCKKIISSLGEHHVARFQYTIAQNMRGDEGFLFENRKNKRYSYIDKCIDSHLNTEGPFRTIRKACKKNS